MADQRRETTEDDRMITSGEVVKTKGETEEDEVVT